MAQREAGSPKSAPLIAPTPVIPASAGVFRQVVDRPAPPPPRARASRLSTNVRDHTGLRRFRARALASYAAGHYRDAPIARARVAIHNCKIGPDVVEVDCDFFSNGALAHGARFDEQRMAFVPYRQQHTEPRDRTTPSRADFVFHFHGFHHGDLLPFADHLTLRDVQHHDCTLQRRGHHHRSISGQRRPPTPAIGARFRVDRMSTASGSFVPSRACQRGCAAGIRCRKTNWNAGPRRSACACVSTKPVSTSPATNCGSRSTFCGSRCWSRHLRCGIPERAIRLADCGGKIVLSRMADDFRKADP